MTNASHKISREIETPYLVLSQRYPGATGEGEYYLQLRLFSEPKDAIHFMFKTPGAMITRRPSEEGAILMKIAPLTLAEQFIAEINPAYRIIAEYFVRFKKGETDGKDIYPLTTYQVLPCRQDKLGEMIQRLSNTQNFRCLAVGKQLLFDDGF